MGIKQSSNQARIGMVNQWLADLKARVVQFDIFGLHLIDHPIAGLADEFAKFHDVIEKAEAKIIEAQKANLPNQDGTTATAEGATQAPEVSA